MQLLLARALVFITSVLQAWKDRFVTAKGARKAAWGCLPVLGLCMVCSVLGQAVGGGASPTPTPVTVVHADYPAPTPSPTTVATTAPTPTEQTQPTPTPTEQTQPTTAPTTAPQRPTATPQEPTAPTTAPTSMPMAEAPPTPTAAPSAAAIGVAVTQNNLAWTVIEATDAGQQLTTLYPGRLMNGDPPPLTTEGKLIRVRFQLQNPGSEDESEPYGWTSQLKLVDAEGNEYEQAEDVYMRDVIPDEEECLQPNLDPGATLTCQAIFDVATDVTGLRFVIPGGGLFTPAEEKLSVSLGL